MVSKTVFLPTISGCLLECERANETGDAIWTGVIAELHCLALLVLRVTLSKRLYRDLGNHVVATREVTSVRGLSERKSITRSTSSWGRPSSPYLSLGVVTDLRL